MIGTEEVKRDTKSLDSGQQHTGTKDDLITYLCLGMAIGHFLSGGTSNIEGGASNSRGIISLLWCISTLDVIERGDLSRR